LGMAGAGGDLLEVLTDDRLADEAIVLAGTSVERATV